MIYMMLSQMKLMIVRLNSHNQSTEIATKVNPAVDSIYVYRIANPKHIKKVIYGIEKDFESMFL